MIQVQPNFFKDNKEHLKLETLTQPFLCTQQQLSLFELILSSSYIYRYAWENESAWLKEKKRKRYMAGSKKKKGSG